MGTARACFEFVRDQIKHSRDYEMDPTTWKASDVLLHGTGYCYAKSHLLAAMLRANGWGCRSAVGGRAACRSPMGGGHDQLHLASRNPDVAEAINNVPDFAPVTLRWHGSCAGVRSPCQKEMLISISDGSAAPLASRMTTDLPEGCVEANCTFRSSNTASPTVTGPPVSVSTPLF